MSSGVAEHGGESLWREIKNDQRTHDVGDEENLEAQYIYWLQERDWFICFEKVRTIMTTEPRTQHLSTENRSR